MAQSPEIMRSSDILNLLSRALPYYLSAWSDIDDDVGLFGSTDPSEYNMNAVGSSSPVIEYVVRPHLQVLVILAAFMRDSQGRRLIEAVDSTKGVTRRLIRGVRWACQTHLTGSRDTDSFLSRRRWGENWRSSLWTTQLALCATMCDTLLPDELRDAVRRVVAFEADRFIGVLPPSGCEVDTKLEENAQDAMLLAWAITMAPDHPHIEQWEHALHVWSVNVAATADDKADHTEYFGRSVAHWVTAETVYRDMTAENHGFFHPDVLSYSMWVVLGIAAYALHDREPPEFLFRRHHQDTFDLLLRFCLPTGMAVAPGGQDLPMFLPRPFALAWGIWHGDPRALRLTERVVAWIKAMFQEELAGQTPWVYGLKSARDGWGLLFQSQVGFEMALLAALPVPDCTKRVSTPGQIESAVDTRRIYPFVEICYRRNTRTTRSVAWKALGQHPAVSLTLHDAPELTVAGRASLIGVPEVSPQIKGWTTLYHNDRFHRDGFETWGRIAYRGGSGAVLLRRDVRVVTWGDDGLLVLDEIVATQDVTVAEQYLSPLYVVNDCWTGGQVQLSSGSLQELIVGGEGRGRPMSCPAHWASVNHVLLVQPVWGQTKGLTYVPSGGRNAPPYWKNCRLDMLAMHVDSARVAAGERVYRSCMFIGAGKGPRAFKCSGTVGELFRGLVIMDGKNTLGLD